VQSSEDGIKSVVVRFYNRTDFAHPDHCAKPILPHHSSASPSFANGLLPQARASPTLDTAGFMHIYARST
jgi:hypothetical protein